jgi:hypothetical protein
MYNLICNLIGETPLRFDFLCDAKDLAERLAYDTLEWKEKDKNNLVAEDSRGELFNIVKT